MWVDKRLISAGLVDRTNNPDGTATNEPGIMEYNNPMASFRIAARTGLSTIAMSGATALGISYGRDVVTRCTTHVLFLAASLLFAGVGIITPDEAFSPVLQTPRYARSGILVHCRCRTTRDRGFSTLSVSGSLLSSAKTDRGLIARLAMVVLPMSAFLNNTPIVAMFVPVILNWSRRQRIAPSRVLMPLSFLAILGGTCTLIGTSTNLVVNGLMQKSGVAPMTLFELSAVGVPYAIIGVIYLVTLGRRSMPDRKELLEQLGETRREFLVEMSVHSHCRLVGQTVEVAGLRHLPGLFLIEIDRGDKLISPVGPDELIRVNDRLLFAGIVSSIVELEKIGGLVPALDPSYEVAPGKRRRPAGCAKP